MKLRRSSTCADGLAAVRRSRVSHLVPPTPSTSAREVVYWRRPSTSRPQPRLLPQITSWQTRVHQLRRLATSPTPQRPPKAVVALDLNQIHDRVHELSRPILQPEPASIPAEERFLDVMRQFASLAKLMLDERGTEDNGRAHAKEQKESATSVLLGSVHARPHPAVISKDSIVNVIGKRAEEMVRHANVFITPAVLQSYVQLQSFLHQPSSFPDVFDLYARKSIPSLNGDEVVYSPSSPDQIKCAVPSETAKEALAAAIEAHQLPLAMDIISTSYCAPAFKKAKTFKQAAVPIAGLGLAPIAAYALSTQFSHLQQTMDPGMATGIAFAGIMTYVGAVAMTGYVAVTTSNDQMDRVTWASGVPLWERWVREEERAAIDQLASAWGFKDPEKRGEEEGEEWLALREWIGSRGMILDRVSLMPGME